MDTIVLYFLFLVCCFCYGYCSPNATTTLVLTEKRCSENNNNNDTSVQYENVTYDDIRELEDQIMKLLSNGDEVRLSDYGIIKHMQRYRRYSPRCYELNGEYKDIRMSISEAMKQPEESLQKSLKDSSGIGYLEEACTFIPLNSVNGSFKRKYPGCTLNGSRDSFDLMTDDIYLTAFLTWESTLDVTDDKFIRYLCTYVVNGFSTNLVSRTSYCGLPTDGTICATDKDIEDLKMCEMCEIIGQITLRYSDKEPAVERQNMYVMEKQLGCRYQTCPFGRKTVGNIMSEDQTKEHLQYLMNEMGHTIYFDDPIYSDVRVLEIDNRPNNDNMCVSIIKDADKVFVKTQNCEVPMKHICKNVSYIKESNNKTGNHTLLIVSVTVCITLVAVLIAVIVKRFFKWNNRASSINAHHGDEFISEMHDGGPPTRRSGTVGLTRPCTDCGSAGSVSGGPGAIGDTSCPTDGGSVPGRSGTVDVSQPTEGGQVYGRLAGGGTNMYYSAAPNN